MNEAEHIAQCLLIKPFVKEQLVPDLNLTFAGALKFSCLNEELLKKTWLSKKKNILQKSAPADYLFKVYFLKAQEQGLPYDSAKTNMLLEKYGVKSSEPLAGEKPQVKEQKSRRPEETKVEIRVLDIEIEYFKFERSKANGEVHPWALEVQGIAWNPFAAMFIEMHKQGNTKERPMAYHIDIVTPVYISPLDLMRNIATVL